MCTQRDDDRRPRAARRARRAPSAAPPPASARSSPPRPAGRPARRRSTRRRPTLERLIASGVARSRRGARARGGLRPPVADLVGCPHRPGAAGAARVTLALDTSALLALAVDGRQRPVVLDALATDPIVVRVGAGADRGAAGDRPAHRRAGAARRPRGRGPADVGPPPRRPGRPALPRPGRDAVATQPVRLTDAIHLAAAERLPGPVRFVTFDPAQIGVALGLGFDVRRRASIRRSRRLSRMADAASDDTALGRTPTSRSTRWSWARTTTTCSSMRCRDDRRVGADRRRQRARAAARAVPAARRAARARDPRPLGPHRRCRRCARRATRSASPPPTRRCSKTSATTCSSTTPR